MPTFARKIDLPLSGAGQGIEAVDLNGDGNTDLAVASRVAACGTAAVFLHNTPAGAAMSRFGPRFDFAVDSNPMFVTTSDNNADGKPDLLVVNQNQVCAGRPMRVSILLNATPPSGSSPASSRADIPADFRRPHKVTIRPTRLVFVALLA